MKNCQKALSKSSRDSRLFSGVFEDYEKYDEMPLRRNERFQRRRRSNHQTKEVDNLLAVSSNSHSAMIMKQTHRENNNRHSSSAPTASQTTRMYMTVKQAAQRVVTTTNQPTYVYQMLRHRPKSLVDSPWSRSLLIGALVILTLTSCLLVQHTASALESNSHEAGHVTLSKSSNQETTKPNERADGPSKTDSLSSSSSEKSIVASLSSAVATAAAAAAVAAAQSSLSSNDARSLSTSSGHHHHGPTQRSPGMSLAIKLVDTIPEVPYNILHNMQKLDHAAPFYNVPNKLSGGTTKELSSTQNFLTNALAASSAGKFGGTAEQLSSLFKSPIWKRIADGYGDFASEFRSLFRPPGAKPMKGPVSPTSKLIRDISVPALLMLLASSISGEWRPVRTRRKSFRPVDIPAALQASGQQGSAPSFLADIKSATTPFSLQYGAELNQQSQPQSFDQSYSSDSSPQATATATNNFAQPTNGDWLEQQQQQQQVSAAAGAARQVLNQQHHQPAQVGPLVRVNGDNNLQPSSAESSVQSNWISPMMQNANGGQDHHHLQNFVSQSASAYNQQQQQQPAVVRRSDEIIAATNKPLGSYAAPNLAALATVAQGGKLISKLLNLNAGDDDGAPHSYRMIAGLVNGRTNENGDKISSSLIKRGDQLSDKQRYSLAGSDETTTQQHKQPARLLSAMAHAVTSMLHPSQNVVGKSGSASSIATGITSVESAAKTTAAGFFSRGNLQNLIGSVGGGGGDKTINHEDSVFMRRQPQAAEQRDLTKLLPEAWREVVKRTMTTVQQQANTQWKSIEGQLTNWVQDKLKTVAASASPGAPTSGAVPAPLANKLASISSTALNILGLNKNNSSSPSTTASATATAAATSAQVSQAKSSQAGGDEPITNVNQRGKINESKATTQVPLKASGALAGVASMIVNVISDRNNNHPAKQSSSPTNSLSSSSLTQKHPNHTDHAHDKPQKSQTLGDLAASVLASSAVSSIASKYPTHTRPEPAGSVASIPSSSPDPSISQASPPSLLKAQSAAPAPSPSSAAAAHPLDR